MLTKSDCLSILVKMEDSGINISNNMKELLISKEIPTTVLEFIVKNKWIEAGNFYEMLRKKHNQKKSPLYLNILKDLENEEQCITTLVCLLVQITLYSNKLERDKELFLKEIRADEVAKVIHEFYSTGDSANCFKLLKLIKTDLLVLECLAGRRTTN